MAIRCYSRRHLLPSLKAQRDLITTSRLSRPASTIAASAYSTLTHDDSNASKNSPTAASASSYSHSSSSVSHPTRSAASTESGSRQPWSFFTPDAFQGKARKTSSGPKHPLVKRLIAEIYSTHRTPAADRVWKAYLDVREGASIDAMGRQSLPLISQLEPAHHQQVLRAIDPDVARSRKISRMKSKLRELKAQTLASASDSAEPTWAFSSLKSNKRSIAAASSPTPMTNVRGYIEKVRVIFREMRRYSSTSDGTTNHSEPSLPSLGDYNHVLTKLSSGGHLAPMSSIWNEMNGITGAGSRGTEPAIIPNRNTYRELMIGLSKHATDQIKRVQKGYAARTGVGKPSRRERERAAQSASSGLAKYGQELAPEARAAAILAAFRTLALIKDMDDHGIQPNQLTIDIAARTLRLAGHLDGLRLLFKQVYGIDLNAPDAPVPPVVGSSQDIRPNIHTLNTILMALGEQTTVPRMIATYETLSRPLPNGDYGVNKDDDDLFQTSWDDDVRNITQAQDQIDSDVPTTFPYSHPREIRPNTKTFEIMIRHCCAPVDPLRTPVPLPSVQTHRSMKMIAEEATESALAQMAPGGSRVEEMQRRTQAEYLVFAKYLASEALETSRRNVQDLAGRLGLELVDTQGLAEAQREDTSGLRAEALNADQAVPTRALEPDFVPFLDPPSLSLTVDMIKPLYSLVSQRRMYSEMRWVRSLVSQALTAKVAEARVLDAAWRTYRARQEATIRAAPISSEAGEIPPLEVPVEKHSDVTLFVDRLGVMYNKAQADAAALEHLLYEQIDGRYSALNHRRKQHSWRIIERKQEAKRREEEERIAAEQEMAMRKASAAEARRLKALEMSEKDEGAEGDNATPTEVRRAAT